MQTIFENHPIFNKYSISEIIDLMFDNENTMHEKRDFNITLNKCKYNKKD